MKNELLEIFSDQDMETLRGGFTDSEMILSEEEVTSEGNGIFRCCNTEIEPPKS